ncbi:MAG: hypothetical protein ACXADA_05505 [Candidatus Hodarchaeales archaeon]
MKREKLLTRSLILMLLSAIFTGMVQNQPLMVAASTSEFFEGFENGTGNWIGIEEPTGTSFTTSTMYKKENSHSGKQGGGGGNIYRTDLWDAPGSFEEGILEGWIYGSHYNHYTKSLIHVLYEEDNNRCGISLYRDSVAVFAVVAGTWYTLGTISLGQSWNNQWWWYKITLENGSPDVISVEIKKEGSSVLTGGPYHITQGNLGYGHVVIKSRVGLYGNHYHDAMKLEVIKPDYFEEDFENGIGDWTTYNPPDDTYLQQSSSFVKESSYSGKQGGGTGSIFRSDRWDAPGTNREGILEGWTYCYHHNFYSSEYIYILYFDDNNNYGFRFYKDHVLLFATINGNVEELGTISLGEGWNFKWWWFKITLYNGEGIFNDHLRLEIQKDGGSKHVISGEVSMGNLNNGHVVLRSRVGNYGKHYFDGLSFTVDPYQIPAPESVEVTRHSPVANNTEDVLLHWKIDSAGAYENESIVVIKDQDQVVVNTIYTDSNTLTTEVPYDTTYYFDVYTRYVDGELVSEWVKAPGVSVYNPKLREDPVIYRRDVALLDDYNINTTFLVTDSLEVCTWNNHFFGYIDYTMTVTVVEWDDYVIDGGTHFDITVATEFHVNRSGTNVPDYDLVIAETALITEWNYLEGYLNPYLGTVNKKFNPACDLKGLDNSQITPKLYTGYREPLTSQCADLVIKSLSIYNGIALLAGLPSPLDPIFDLIDAGEAAFDLMRLSSTDPGPADESHVLRYSHDGWTGSSLQADDCIMNGTTYAKYSWTPKLGFDITHLTIWPQFNVYKFPVPVCDIGLVNGEIIELTLQTTKTQPDYYPDQDNDDIPDDYDPYPAVADDYADYDSDGYDNLREYVQGTDPLDYTNPQANINAFSAVVKGDSFGASLWFHSTTHVDVLKSGDYLIEYYYQQGPDSPEPTNWIFITSAFLTLESGTGISAGHYTFTNSWLLQNYGFYLTYFRKVIKTTTGILVDERIVVAILT